MKIAYNYRFRNFICFYIIVLFRLAFCISQEALPILDWEKTYGGSGEDYALHIDKAKDNKFIICGRTDSYGDGSYDSWFLCIDSIGDTLWTKVFKDQEVSYAECIKSIKENEYIACGYNNDLRQRSWIMHLKDNGDTLWNKSIPGMSIARSIAIADNGYVVVGTPLVKIVKLNTDGDTVWTKTFGGSENEEGRDIKETYDGGYIIAGWTESFASGGSDVYLVKTDVNGNEEWTSVYGLAYNEYAGAVHQTSDSGYIIAGRFNSFGYGGYDNCMGTFF